jgi:hypothetical protein
MPPDTKAPMISRVRPYAVVTLALTFVHGGLLLNDGQYWDGWIIWDAMVRSEWSKIYTMFHQSGRPLFYYVLRAVGSLPAVSPGFHIVAFVCIVGAALAFFAILRRLRAMGDVDAALVTIAAFSYPAMQASVELVNFPYFVMQLAFFVGLFAAVTGEDQSGRARIGWRVAALALIAIGFTLHSLLAFYFAFLLGWFLARRKNAAGFIAEAMAFVKTHADYCALPFVVWFATKKLFPVYGYYAEYNQIRGPMVAVSSFGFFTSYLFDQLDAVFSEALRAPFTLAVLTALVAFAVLRLKRGGDEQPYAPVKVIAVVAAAGLFLAIFPYAAVGRFPTVLGWNSRHGLLVAAPAAIALYGLVRAIAGSPLASSRIALGVYAFIAASLGLYTAKTYVGWQARWAKDAGIIAQLKAMPPNEASIYAVDDDFKLAGEGDYRFYEWSTMFKTAWGGEARVGVNQDAQFDENLALAKTLSTPDYNLSQLDPEGCRAKLIIRRGKKTYDETGIAARYLFYRYVRKAELPKFFSDIVSVEIAPQAAQPGTHCAAQTASDR